MVTPDILWRFPAAVAVCLLLALTVANPSRAAVTSRQVFSTPGSLDQDDMCIWVHPSDPALSTVITSDKQAGRVFVYDLAGNLLQSIASPFPGNIDVRYGILLGGDCVDLVAFNDRDEQKIRVYAVDPTTRSLSRVDDGTIVTGPNYGFTLHRGEDGSLYGITGPKVFSPRLRQYRLFDDGAGQVSGAITGWQFQGRLVEGMVADDSAGYVFLAEENHGIWRVSTTDDTDKQRIATVGDSSGLTADVEGLTIYKGAGGTGYLIASSQGSDEFIVYDRRPPHAPLGTFSIAGVGQTDGIDVLNLSLNDDFPQGIFTFHNGEACCPVQATRWDEIAAQLGGLLIDTQAWHPRETCGPFLAVSDTELNWTAVDPATSYDLIRGQLEALHVLGGDFSAAQVDCLENDLEALAFSWADTPPTAGGGFWMLVRGVAPFGNLPWNSFGPALSGSRDDPPNAVGNVCP